MGVPFTYNLRNLAERKATTLMTAVGIGLTVAVLVTSLALSEGLKSVFASSGDPRQALVLRKGTNAELSSTVSNDTYQIVRQIPGIAEGPDGLPLVSPEGVVVVNQASVEAPEGMSLTVRGLLPIGTTMRKFDLTAGRLFSPGLREVMVGESVAKRYPAAKLGGKLKFGRGEWDVVGIFRAGESSANSEIWTDLDQLRGDYESQGGSNSLLVRMRDESAVAGFTKSIEDDQRLGSTAVSEKKYYADQTSAGLPLMTLGFFVATVMAIGSAFAATNTMYAAVSRRSKEIGTLRSIGFGRGAILRSFVLESVCLSLLGGIVGVLMTLPINGLQTGVGNFVTFSETTFKFRVTPLAAGIGLAFATVIGLIGGLLPAWSASRKGIVAAMRDG